jgi:hypothetical protein
MVEQQPAGKSTENKNRNGYSSNSKDVNLTFRFGSMEVRGTGGIVILTSDAKTISNLKGSETFTTFFALSFTRAIWSLFPLEKV